jgi:hypothetical protein
VFETSRTSDSHQVLHFAKGEISLQLKQNWEKSYKLRADSDG